MHLQVRLEPAVRIANLGDLAIVGATEHNDEWGNPEDTTVTFLLTYPANAPFVKYLGGHGDPSSLSYRIFRDDGYKTMELVSPVVESVSDASQRFVIFTQNVMGKLRDPRKFLYSIARMLAREVEQSEEAELADREVDETQDWCYRDQFHPGQAGREPEPHKRHEAIVAE